MKACVVKIIASRLVLLNEFSGLKRCLRMRDLLLETTKLTTHFLGNYRYDPAVQSFSFPRKIDIKIGRPNFAVGLITAFHVTLMNCIR